MTAPKKSIPRRPKGPYAWRPALEFLATKVSKEDLKTFLFLLQGERARRERAKKRRARAKADPALTLDDLALTVRIRKALEARNITTVPQLTALTIEEFLDLPNIGNRTVLTTVRDALAVHRLHLRGDPPPE